MIDEATLGLIGFSVCSAGLLLVAGITSHADAARSRLSRGSGMVLLVGLALLQIAHWQQLRYAGDVVASKAYIGLLFVVAPAFHLFFRGALQPRSRFRLRELLYLAPLLAGPWLPPAAALPLAFLIGAAYALHLAVLVYRLRAQRRLFRLELATFAAFMLVALAILAFGLASPWIGTDAFVRAYAILIGLAFGLALHVLLRFPDLAGTAAEAVANAYAVSTLARVDRECALARLRRLMDEERIYADETLQLARLAKAVELTPHQLSELINTDLGIGYSRYIREQRVAAAQRMLLDEPSASVLSVGLAVGFTSQSNFYAAFREITGEVPGRYRRSRPAAS